MNPANNRARPWGVSAVILVVLACVYIVFGAFHEAGNTGRLIVKSSNDKNAILSVAGQASQAGYIGTGSANIRLKPGSYIVASSDSGQQASAVVNIKKSQTTNLKLDTSSGLKLPSVDNESFNGLAGLLNSGLSTQQTELVKTYLFAFKPTGQTVNIDDSSIYLGPHNPDVDTSFSIDFSFKLDQVKYSAVIVYSDQNSLRLTVQNQQLQQVFDSASISG